MKQIKTVDEIHSIALQALIYLDSVCKENNLTYFLAGGTMLGAVRHKGFIPWDEDIDIAMPRSDYEKFIQICSEKKSNYKVITTENSKLYNRHFAKLVDRRTFVSEPDIPPMDDYGIFIDIFPLDGLGNSRRGAIMHCLQIRFWSYMSTSSRGLENLKANTVKNVLRKIKFKVLVCCGSERIYRICREKCKKYDFYKSDYVGSVAGGIKGLKEIFERRVYSETMDVEFEGVTVSGMKYYDEYLKNMYGDYMKLPPKEQQISNHDFTAYWRDDE